MSSGVSFNGVRPGTEKQVILPSVSPTSISCGTSELKILRYMFNHIHERFNIRGFFRHTGIPRSTITDALNRLISKGLVEKQHAGNYKITAAGVTFVEVSSGGAGDSRRECRGVTNLSQHFTRFVMPIKDKGDFVESMLNELHALEWKPLKLHNLLQYYVYFQDATIIINPKQVIFRIHDLISEGSEETMLESFNKALAYASKLSSVHILGDTLVLDNVHFARVQSIFAEFLEKVDERYFLDLGDGRKFWIDFSNGKKEDETNDAQLRNRLDEFMKDLVDSHAVFSDVDKMKEVLGELVKLEIMRKTKGGINEKI